ncbi:hypothetical protein BY996DRAFT_7851666 [Phakopsora pachyrhizi]|nr:hypothetical protein BY996DRAFT_7851666 [Phakopsora pachyrhizi]
MIKSRLKSNTVVEDFFNQSNNSGSIDQNQNHQPIIRRHNNDSYNRFNQLLDEHCHSAVISKTNQKRPRSHHYLNPQSSFLQLDCSTPTKQSSKSSPFKKTKPFSTSSKRSKSIVLDELLIGKDNESEGGLSGTEVSIDKNKNNRGSNKRQRLNLSQIFKRDKENKVNEDTKEIKGKASNDLTIFQLAKYHPLDSPSSKPPSKAFSPLQKLVEPPSLNRRLDPNPNLVEAIDHSVLNKSKTLIKGITQVDSNLGSFKPSSLSHQILIPPFKPNNNNSGACSKPNGNKFISPPPLPDFERVSDRERLVQVSPYKKKAYSNKVDSLLNRAKMISESDDTRLRMWRSDLEAGLLKKASNCKTFKILRIINDHGVIIVECVEIVDNDDAQQIGGEDEDLERRRRTIILSGEEVRERVLEGQQKVIRIYKPWNQIGFLFLFLFSFLSF